MGDIPPSLNSQKVQRILSPPPRPIQVFHLPVSQYQGLSPWGQSLQERQHTCKVILKRVRATILHGEAVSTLYSECVSVALITRHAIRMRRVIFLSVVCVAVFFHIIFKMA
jgi:hypothetical protein